MATIWTLDCENSGKHTSLKLEHTFFSGIFSDTWTAVTPSDWDVPGGKTPNFGQPVVFLSNGTGTPHQLEGFTTSTKVDDTGTGTKNAIDGDFPIGDFNWTCTAKD